ncbi:MAG: nucleotidyltransferase domain-containing protein [bacterium]
MSKLEAKKIVKKYSDKLKKADYPFSAVYLFGSYATGGAKKWSDIDVAVVSDRLKKNYDEGKFLLWDLRMDVDTRIEPHGFTEADFKANTNPLIYEIKTTGIKIA